MAKRARTRDALKEMNDTDQVAGDPLAEPGDADLTAHVDFARLAETAREQGADVFGPVAQGRFLEALGIGVRAQRLKDAAPGDYAASSPNGAQSTPGGVAAGSINGALCAPAALTSISERACKARRGQKGWPAGIPFILPLPHVHSLTLGILGNTR